jgi:hypothetical protein
MVHANVDKAIAQMRRGVAKLDPEDVLISEGLGDDDVRASLAEALKVNTTLAELVLYHNTICAAGASSLAEALGVNTALTKLNLGSNPIRYPGAASLAEAMRVNTTLTTLDLSHSYLAARVPPRSRGAIGINISLKSLIVITNPVSAALEAAVASNPLALVPVTATQRMAFFTGHLRRTHQQSPLTRLPYDMVRRILTRYKVAQGRREWAEGRMTVRPL